MNTLIFHNPGEIDIRGACIAGLSAKEGESPIGYFGTGLKYSIACILRWGGTITIYSGEQRYDFISGAIEYRGTEFHQIIMRIYNPDETYGEMALGFTTEYGKNWEPWQVFRELYANARDENGFVQLDQHHSMIGEGWTHIFVECKELIESFYQRDTIILPTDKTYDHQSTDVQFNSTQAIGLYYRGVRVWDRACLFTWNFLGKMTLTEDRQLRSTMDPSCMFDRFLECDLHDVDAVMKLLQLKFEINDIKLTRTVNRDGQPLVLQERPMEATFMDWWTVPETVQSWHSSEFKEVCKNLYARDHSTYSKLRSYVRSIDAKLVEDKLHKMTTREQLMFDKAKELVALFGFEDEIAQLPIQVQELGGAILGLYENGNIYLSPKLFDQGTKQLTATLYEECYHHRTKQEDCTYNMQNDLFNIIISLNEELHKVIC